jgi:hypothetical protein
LTLASFLVVAAGFATSGWMFERPVPLFDVIDRRLTESTPD